MLSYAAAEGLVSGLCLYSPYGAPQLCARNHVRMENVWDQTSVYAPPAIKDVSALKVEYSAPYDCRFHLANFLPITCVSRRHLAPEFLSDSPITLRIDSRCERVRFPWETVFPALREHTR